MSAASFSPPPTHGIEWGAGPAPGPNGADRPFVQYSIRAGTTITDRISITNLGRKPLTFDLYPSDAYDTASGTFTLAAASAPKRSVGAWITLPFHTITVAPSHRDLIPFELTVPADAIVGDHAGGIVALERIPSPAPGAHDQVVTRQGIGTRIYVRVAGPLYPHLTVTGLHVQTSVSFAGGGHGLVAVTIINDGNKTLDGTVTFRVTGLLGSASPRWRPIAVHELLPDNSVRVEQSWTRLPFAGPVTVKATVTYSPNRSSSSTTATWVLPAIVELAAGLLSTSAAVLWYRRRRKRRAPQSPVLSPSRTAVDEGTADRPAEAPTLPSSSDH